MNITVKVFDSEDSPGAIPGNAVEFVAWLSRLVESVPPEFRGSATVELGSFESYGDSEWTFRVSYVRPENSEEATRRAAYALAVAEDARERNIKAAVSTLTANGFTVTKP